MAELFDRLNRLIGHLTSWLSLLLILVIIVDVFFRYAFSMTSAASFEIEWHLFSLLFLLSSGWTLQQDRHVRVDVFYQRFSERKKAWVNLTGVLFFLLPLCFAGVVEGFEFTLAAYELGETSPDPGGLPARFLIKSVIPAGFFLLGLQGISVIFKTIHLLLSNEEKGTGS